jgi:hypothetical protein
MFAFKRGSVVLAATVLCIATAFAQQAPSEGSPIARSVRLNVVITTASGQCVTDLQQHDFKIFDNNLPQTITSFRAVTISPKQVEVPDRAYAAGDGASTGCYEQGEFSNMRSPSTFQVTHGQTSTTGLKSRCTSRISLSEHAEGTSHSPDVRFDLKLSASTKPVAQDQGQSPSLLPTVNGLRAWVW